MNHSLQCNCGKVQGEIEAKGITNHVVCYCLDCQKFANYLSSESDVLDQNGGTIIVQLSPSGIRITAGLDQISCLRLTENGLLRWYAGCCNTPLGNTLSNYKVSFVGLIHSCIIVDNLESSFGRVRARSSTESAIGSVKGFGVLGVLSRFLIMVLSNRLQGDYKITPFFSKSGIPVVEPRILTEEE